MAYSSNIPHRVVALKIFSSIFISFSVDGKDDIPSVCVNKKQSITLCLS